MEVVDTPNGRLHIRLYTGNLMRADKEFFEKRLPGLESPSRSKIIYPPVTVLATEVYANKPYNQIKFFSTTREEVVPYAERGNPNINTFTTQEPLRLLEMQNPETRATLLAGFAGRNRVVSAIQTSFPTANGRIYRYSSPETQVMNDISLRSMCEMEGIDGFYTPREQENPQYKFHSEFGICRRAFVKLQLVSTEKSGLSVSGNIKRGWVPGMEHHAVADVDAALAMPGVAVPANAVPANAMPANGMPANAVHANAVPANAMPAVDVPAISGPVHHLAGLKRGRLNFKSDNNGNNGNHRALYSSKHLNAKRTKKERVTRKKSARKSRRFRR